MIVLATKHDFHKKNFMAGTHTLGTTKNTEEEKHLCWHIRFYQWHWWFCCLNKHCVEIKYDLQSESLDWQDKANQLSSVFMPPIRYISRLLPMWALQLQASVRISYSCSLALVVRVNPTKLQQSLRHFSLSFQQYDYSMLVFNRTLGRGNSILWLRIMNYPLCVYASHVWNWFWK